MWSRVLYDEAESDRELQTREREENALARRVNRRNVERTDLELVSVADLAVQSCQHVVVSAETKKRTHNVGYSRNLRSSSVNFDPREPFRCLLVSTCMIVMPMGREEVFPELDALLLGRSLQFCRVERVDDGGRAGCGVDDDVLVVVRLPSCGGKDHRCVGGRRGGVRKRKGGDGLQKWGGQLVGFDRRTDENRAHDRGQG